MRGVACSRVAVLGYRVKEALNSFILDDHAIIQEGYHEDLLEVSFLHRQHYHQSYQEAYQAPNDTHNEQF